MSFEDKRQLLLQHLRQHFVIRNITV